MVGTLCLILPVLPRTPQNLHTDKAGCIPLCSIVPGRGEGPSSLPSPTHATCTEVQRLWDAEVIDTHQGQNRGRIQSTS